MLRPLATPRVPRLCRFVRRQALVAVGIRTEVRREPGRRWIWVITLAPPTLTRCQSEPIRPQALFLFTDFLWAAKAFSELSFFVIAICYVV